MQEMLAKAVPLRSVRGGNPPLVTCYGPDSALWVSMRVMVSYMADAKGYVPRREILLVSPPSEVTPPHDVESGLENCSADMAPQVPLHSQGVGGPSSDLVFVHEGSCFTHSADVPVLPPFRRGSLPSHHGPDLEKLRTVSSTMCLKSSAGSRLHFGNDGDSLPSERNRCS